MMENKSLEILKQYWSYSKFRSLQEEVIQSVLQGKDTLALMPTGGGKSICFQVPAMHSTGICIVVSPLIALMKDQVEQLRKRDISAVAIYSGMSTREIDIALDNCIFGDIKFLYLAPERLYSDIVKERIRNMKVNLFAIDEAHCISQWGYDFRPSYLHINQIRELHPEAPVLALTATATEKVIQDIQNKLLFRKENVFQKSFARTNLGYMVLYEENKMGRLVRIIRKVGGAGVVYVRNRRETQEIASYLLSNGVPADFYHAGVDMESRDKKQIDWMQNRFRVMVATNAFGMGIDKTDVRFVIHMDIPDSLESYFQEAGRAGRDGQKAFPVMLYNQEDRKRLTQNFEKSFPTVHFIKKTYHHLCNFFQIAYGSGRDLTLDFDVSFFSKKYNLEILSVMSALKFLEREEWMALTEAVFVPSRLKFEVNFQELYKFQIQYFKYDALIKNILRSYGGVFDMFVPINEYDFAKRLKLPYSEIVNMLTYLQEIGIVTYQPHSDSPKITFLKSRVEQQNLYIDTKFRAERKAVKEGQVQAMYEYLDAKSCRSQVLLGYFGEMNAARCNECDLCLISNHKKGLEKKLTAEVESILKKEVKTIHELVDALSIGDDKTKLRVIRNLLDREMIFVEAELYRWHVSS